MRNRTLDIDQIVREVLERLERMVEHGAPEVGETAAAEARSAERGARSAAKPAEVLALAERVVSTAQLDGRLDGVRRVRVRPKAVVTPAARDLLREKKIEIEVAVSTAVMGNAKTRLVVGAAETHFSPAQAVRSLAARGVQVEQLARTGLATVTNELAEQVRKSGILGLLLTEETLAAVVLANRHAGVRAALAGCADSVEKAKRTIGVNLLVVNPRGKNAGELEAMLDAFTRDGVLSCPAKWSDAL
jgi:ribose 5-phosphate isomerase RpiB